MLFELMIFSHSQNHTIFSWLYKLDQNKTIYIFTIFLNLGLACISSWGEKKRKGREVKKKNKCPTVLSSKIHCPMHAIIKVCCMPWHGLTPPTKQKAPSTPPPLHMLDSLSHSCIPDFSFTVDSFSIRISKWLHS